MVVEVVVATSGVLGYHSNYNGVHYRKCNHNNNTRFQCDFTDNNHRKKVLKKIPCDRRNKITSSNTISKSSIEQSSTCELLLTSNDRFVTSLVPLCDPHITPCDCQVTSPGHQLASCDRAVTSCDRGVVSCDRGVTSCVRGMISCDRGVTSYERELTSCELPEVTRVVDLSNHSTPSLRPSHQQGSCLKVPASPSWPKSDTIALRSVLTQHVMILVTLLLISFTVLPSTVHSAPLNALPSFIGDETQRFLMQYGYLPMSDLEMGNLRTHTELEEAVKRLQRIGHIPQTGVVDDATRELMRRPRCSLPDIPPEEGNDAPYTTQWGSKYGRGGKRRTKRYVKQGNTWNKFDLTWGVINYPGRLTSREVQRELHLATELWARPSKLTFNQLTDKPGKADIVVQFNEFYHGDGYPFDGPGKTLAHAFYPGTGIGGDIHFDATENWVQHVDSINNSYEHISLFLTAAHELGHALGLYHSEAQNSIMSPYLNVHMPAVLRLPPDDVAAVQDLYGVNAGYEPSDIPRVTSSPDDDNRDMQGGGAPSHPTRGEDTGVTTIPDTCHTSYDAISVIRRGVYVFRGKYFWRIDEGQRVNPEPVELQRFWYCLPSNVTRIDAVYERPNKDSIVFFSGPHFYVCSGNDRLQESGPLRKLGLPESLTKIDAAFVWGHNSRTYFMADTMYWKFDEAVNHVELDYPRDIGIWKGVPYGGIDAAFKFNGTTYFFKGKVFWEFDDLRMKVRPKSPLLSAPFWMGCSDNAPNSYQAALNQASTHISITTPLLSSSLLILAFISYII